MKINFSIFHEPYALFSIFHYMATLLSLCQCTDPDYLRQCLGQLREVVKILWNIYWDNLTRAEFYSV